MSVTTVYTEKAPAAVGPYSQAIACCGFLFVSGQIPVDPEAGTIPEGIEAQTDLAMRNLSAVLQAGGCGMADVLKTTVFIRNMDDFATINTIYAKYMNGHAPARACVEVSRLPKGVLVEVEAIAVVNK